MTLPDTCVALYWLPLGAGGHSVKYNGRLYEWIVAARERRAPRALYHAALEVHRCGERFVIELGPALGGEEAARRGVCVEGPVGVRAAGRLRLFRYQLRCWQDGIIPDVGYAVASPTVLTTDGDRVARLLRNVRDVPSLVWGRDEIGAGDMWNSNSVVSWLLETSGIGADVPMPHGGRAPGWTAGIRLARDRRSTCARSVVSRRCCAGRGSRRRASRRPGRRQP